jgi:serine/threonine-protein kinase
MSNLHQQIGQYTILGPIGAGGMGEVYAARDPILGRKVAIKVLPVRLTGDRDTLTRFTQEARSASALNHPNIVTIHEVGTEASGTPYIVMEYVEGRDLRSFVNEPPPNRKLLDIAAQIADGLAAAHERGIVHRDLKPENLMVTNDGYVKILDFGLAKIVRPAPGEGDVTAQLEMPGTTPGTILGTVGYMSPEQATGRKLDFRSDQFALGAILYELATGKPAFDGETAIDTLSAILHDEPEPIQKTNPRAPAELCWIVGRLLSKDPNDRYASTRDLAQELHAIRDRVATQASGTELPFRPAQKTKPLLWGGLLVALAAVGVFVAERGMNGRNGVEPDSKKYLAVLPFKDLSGDKNGQLVVDGFAETLITRLGHFPAVQVMRPSSPEVPAANTVRQIARDLGASLALTGSMQRNGDRVRVSYRIVDVAKGKELPGELIEGTTADLFTIQDRLAESVASTLSLGAPRVKPQTFAAGISQQRYLEALGAMRRYDNEASVDSAINILEDLAARSNSASVQAALGRAYLEKFQLTHDEKWAAPASAACERAVATDAQNPDVHVTLGELRRQTGRLDDAVTEFKAALASQPNNADAILGLAQTHGAAGRLKEAEQAYRQSIDLQPNFWGGYNKLGAFFAAHGRYPESAKMFEKVTQLVPDNLRGYNNLGAVYEQMGRYDDAIRVFQQTMVKKKDPQAFSNLGTCYYFLGRYKDAGAAFQNAVNLSPNLYFYWANLGDAYRWVPGAESQAAAAYDRAIVLSTNDLRLNASDAGVRARLAECLAKRNHIPEALVEIERARKTDPTNVGIMYRAAVIANLRHDDQATVDLLRNAIAHGYERAEVERDPEFALLRETQGYKQAMTNRVQ